MALCTFCLRNKMPMVVTAESYGSCPKCGGQLDCAGYTIPGNNPWEEPYPVCDECGLAPFLVCFSCQWFNFTPLSGKVCTG